MGRRYASVSGDVNPMHLSSLAAIESRLLSMYVVDVVFSRPLLLPSVVSFLVAPREPGVALRGAAGGRVRGSSAWRGPDQLTERANAPWNGPSGRCLLYTSPSPRD